MITYRGWLVTMDDTWIYHYDLEAKRYQWSGVIDPHPAQKIAIAKNPL
jgi:hypothetical protein